MLKALFAAGLRPDLVLGTSIGAINGVMVAADPTPNAPERLTDLWTSTAAREVFSASPPRQLATLARTRTHLHSPEPLRRLLEAEIGPKTFDDLPVHFECCAANIERAAEHWFTTGPVIQAVLASSAVPGLLPPVVVDGYHYIDGGIVNSIPVGRALELGARRIFVLQVGRVDHPLQVPRRPWEVASVAFEIARRHRFARDMANLPTGVEVHVLPTGAENAPPVGLWAPLAYRDFSRIRSMIHKADQASRAYLRDRLGLLV